MKKVLFGLCALALSATAFGAISSEVIDGGVTKVTLPVELRANVVDGTNRLFIAGTSGQSYGNVLKLDFYDLTKGSVGQSYGEVKVWRGLSDGTGSAVGDEATPFGGDLSVKFYTADDTAGKELVKNDQLSVKLTSADLGEGGTPVDINTNIFVGKAEFNSDTATNSTEYNATFTATTETIADKHVPGLYLGTANITAELTLN